MTYFALEANGQLGTTNLAEPPGQTWARWTSSKTDAHRRSASQPLIQQCSGVEVSAP